MLHSEGEIVVEEQELLYPQLAILMNGINCITRPAFAWTYQFLIIIDMTLANCSLTLARRQDQVPMTFFVIIGTVNLLIILVLYFVLTRVEGLYKESVKLLSSRTVIIDGGRCKGKNSKEKRRKERKLQDRKPKRHMVRMPLYWEIGMFTRMDHGAALDFLQTVVERTFDALILF